MLYSKHAMHPLGREARNRLNTLSGKVLIYKDLVNYRYILLNRGTYKYNLSKL